MRMRFGSVVAAATFVGVGLAGPASARSAVPSPAPICDGRWHRIESVNPAHDNGDYDSLVSVSVLSSTDAWAVGIVDDFSQGGGYRTLTEHWDGARWSLVPSPNSTKTTWNQLSAVAAVASDDVWTVGIEGFSPYGSLIEHWNGTSWTIQDDGTPDTYLTSVSALGPDDVWAAGSTNYVGNGLIMHWDGTAWTRTLIAGAIVFRGIVALAPNDIWAVGQQAHAGEGDFTVAAHFDGTTWTRYPTPNPLRIHDIDQNWLTSVTAVSSSDIWATGIARDHDYGIFDRPFMVHWDGTRWTLSPTPDPGGSSEDTDLWSGAAFGGDDAWAVGSVGNEPDWTTFTGRWDGSSWTQLASSTGGRFLAMAPDGSGGLWGVGDRSVSHPYVGTATLVQHLC